MLGLDAKAARYTWTAAIVILLLYLAYVVRQTLFIFIVSVLFAYLLYPAVAFLDRLLPSKSRTPALVVVFLLFIGILAFACIEIGSLVVVQANALAHRLPDFIAKLKQPASVPLTPSAQSLQQTMVTGIESQLRNHYNDIGSLLPALGLKVLEASSNLIFLIIVPIISFFLLLEGKEMLNGVLGAVSETRYHEMAKRFFADVHELLLQYMRALLILCAVVFVVFSIVFTMIGVPFGLLLAAVASPLEFIPMIGPLAAAAIIIGVAIFSGYAHWWWIAIFLAAFRLNQDYFLSPKLLSAGVQLNPVLVILGVFAGAEIAGLPGSFLSVPVLALLRVAFRRLQSSRIVQAQSVLQ